MRLDDGRMRRHRPAAALGFCAALAAAAQSPAVQRFRNLTESFLIDLPIGWRQLSPNEARRVAEMPGAPPEIGYVEPRLFYAVGPVDEWLSGRFEGPWLWVVEQDSEWQVGEDVDREVAPQLAEMWRAKGEAGTLRHELGDVRREAVGPGKHPALTAQRTSTPKAPGRATRSLDVHAPAGGRQYSLSLTCWSEDWDRWQPEFRRWLGTLTFARGARGAQKLSDRLWTPIVTGAAVGLVLLLLYKHTHRRS